MSSTTSIAGTKLNRLAEARRCDRGGSAAPTWRLKVRQRYRYDGANQRTVKQTLDLDLSSGVEEPPDGAQERIALYVLPGDFERRGLVRGELTYEPTPTGAGTQYLVAGARLVWRNGGDPGLHENRRLTVPLSDVIQTTAATLDLISGDLLEASTYYPNGARETFFADTVDPSAAEPAGFTGKEADEEVGPVYFGERYLIPRLGRWASPDPLHVYVAGGGETLNAFHYVSGNVLQARDPIGLDWTEWSDAGEDGNGEPLIARENADAGPGEADMEFRFADDTVSPRDIPQTHAGIRERAAQHAAAQALPHLASDAAALVHSVLSDPIGFGASVIVETVALPFRVAGALGESVSDAMTGAGGGGAIDFDRMDGDPVRLGRQEGSGRPLAIVLAGASIGLAGPGLAPAGDGLAGGTASQAL